jgi:hypothetical protein
MADTFVVSDDDGALLNPPGRMCTYVLAPDHEYLLQEKVLSCRL